MLRCWDAVVIDRWPKKSLPTTDIRRRRWRSWSRSHPQPVNACWNIDATSEPVLGVLIRTTNCSKVASTSKTGPALTWPCSLIRRPHIRRLPASSPSPRPSSPWPRPSTTLSRDSTESAQRRTATSVPVHYTAPCSTTGPIRADNGFLVVANNDIRSATARSFLYALLSLIRACCFFCYLTHRQTVRFLEVLVLRRLPFDFIIGATDVGYDWLHRRHRYLHRWICVHSGKYDNKYLYFYNRNERVFLLRLVIRDILLLLKWLY